MRRPGKDLERVVANKPETVVGGCGVVRGCDDDGKRKKKWKKIMTSLKRNALSKRPAARPIKSRQTFIHPTISPHVPLRVASPPAV